MCRRCTGDSPIGRTVFPAALGDGVALYCAAPFRAVLQRVVLRGLQRVVLRRYLQQAAELGDGDALYCLADMHLHGTDGCGMPRRIAT